MLNEAKNSRPSRRGRGQSYEAEAEAKIIMKKYQIMINNVWFKILPEKLTKFPNFTRFLYEKSPIT